MPKKSKDVKKKLEMVSSEYEKLLSSPGAKEAKDVHEYCLTASDKRAEKYIGCADPKLKKIKEKYGLK